MRYDKYLFVVLVVALVDSLANGAAPSKDIPWSKVPDINVQEIKEEILADTAEILEKVESYGGCKKSIAECLRTSSAKTPGRLARDIVVLVANKKGLKEINDWVANRKNMAHPKSTYQFELDYLTPLGSRDAKVVIVEFSDFQCPFCAMVAPMLEGEVQRSEGQVSLYLKQFPIKTHPRSLAAAKACVASDSFGKFWGYCSALYQKRADLSDAGLLRMAERAGIDTEALQKKMQHKSVLDRIAKEKVEGLRSRVEGTPSIYINGKKITVSITSDLIRDRIEEELDILNGKD